MNQLSDNQNKSTSSSGRAKSDYGTLQQKLDFPAAKPLQVRKRATSRLLILPIHRADPDGQPVQFDKPGRVRLVIDVVALLERGDVFPVQAVDAPPARDRDAPLVQLQLDGPRAALRDLRDERVERLAQRVEPPARVHELRVLEGYLVLSKAAEWIGQDALSRDASRRFS